MIGNCAHRYIQGSFGKIIPQNEELFHHYLLFGF